MSEKQLTSVEKIRGDCALRAGRRSTGHGKVDQADIGGGALGADGLHFGFGGVGWVSSTGVAGVRVDVATASRFFDRAANEVFYLVLEVGGPAA